MSRATNRSLADVLSTTLQVDMVVMMMSSSWVSHRERCIKYVLPHAQSSNTVSRRGGRRLPAGPVRGPSVPFCGRYDAIDDGPIITTTPP
eukprot:scaffold2053_cov106-Skeletonema_dohrnii-CCMP3373.AAC.6